MHCPFALTYSCLNGVIMGRTDSHCTHSASAERSVSRFLNIYVVGVCEHTAITNNDCTVCPVYSPTVLYKFSNQSCYI